MNKTVTLSALFAVLACLSTTQAQAQKVDSKMINKARWYNSPREYQIIDERPTVKDFREAPESPQQIDLPPGPQGAGGGFGGPGAGAGGGDPGGAASNPVQLGGPNPGYRNAPAGLQSLPKSGFGRESNIPARGMGPKGPLPGVTTGVLGKLMTPVKGQGMGAGAPRGMQAKSAQAAPALQVYGSYAGSGSSGSGSRTDTAVRGTLLRSK